MNERNQDICMEIDEIAKLTDEKVREYIKKTGNLENVSDIQRLDKEERNKILRKAKEMEGVSILQISRVTGVNRVSVKKS